MKKFAVSVMVIGLVSATTLLGNANNAMTANSYSCEVDAVHSTNVFKIQHAGAANFYGRFNDMSGTFTLDEANPGNSSFHVTIKTESVDTADSKRDDHLKSPDFFNAREYPEITFKSTSVKRGDPSPRSDKPRGPVYMVTGDLSLHGTTKSITVPVQHVGTGEMRGTKIVGVETTFTIKRTDFGMNYGVGTALGDEVEVTISLEGRAK